MKTPGPWKWEIALGAIEYEIFVDDNKLVATAEYEEDARLIAAAPELLEACEAALDHQPNLDLILEKVIKKAKGE